MIGASPGAIADNIKLPDLGDSSAAVVTPLQEQQMGENFIRRARRSLLFNRDPEINDYIQRLGEKLAAKSDRPDQKFLFFVVNNRNINAFAVPGGFVGVHNGLILTAKSEGELAAVMAHEIAHVTQRHIPRLIAGQKRASVPSMAAILAAILLGGSSKNAGAIVAATQAAAIERQLNFSRRFEEEADRHGIQVLARAGYDPKHMPRFFGRMQQANRYNEGGLPEFLSTHPVTYRRIAESRNRVSNYPGPYKKIDNTNFYHIRAKIRANSRRSSDVLVKRFARRLQFKRFKNAEEKSAERYGHALVLAKNNQYSLAHQQITILLKQKPNYPAYLIARANIALRAGKTDQSIQYYRQAIAKYPRHYPILHNYVEALLKSRRYQTARVELKKILQYHDNKPQLYKMLSMAAGNRGDRVEAHRALAEYYYMNGYPKTAIRQLEISARFAKKDFYAMSSIEARIKEIKAEIELFKNG